MSDSLRESNVDDILKYMVWAIPSKRYHIRFCRRLVINGCREDAIVVGYENI